MSSCFPFYVPSKTNTAVDGVYNKPTFSFVAVGPSSEVSPAQPHANSSPGDLAGHGKGDRSELTEKSLCRRPSGLMDKALLECQE